MQGNMAKALKYRASKQEYSSQNQLAIPGFETPFAQHLYAENRWLILAAKIPWDSIVSVYEKQMHNSQTGADGINPRVAIGALIIKHICDLSDRETILQIQENVYMQYFIGYSSFSNEEAFDPSLFVDIRKRLGAEQINEINERILGLGLSKDTQKEEKKATDSESEKVGAQAVDNGTKQEIEDRATCNEGQNISDNTGIADAEQKTVDQTKPNQGQLIVDATACPQDIRYPTDLDLLNDAREKSEELIDHLYCPSRHSPKPRTYREIARKVYLATAQKKKKTKKEIRNAIKKQLSYLRRNIKSIHKLLDTYESIPLDRHQYKYLLVIQTFYEQQHEMFTNKTHQADHRIVSIHQPHVRPIVRGKANAKVEFGAKIEVSIMNGFSFLEELSWEAYNESTRLINTIEKYRMRFGFYPKEVLADKIYCTRDNRKKLKLRGIALRGKPLGRPKAVEVHVSPGERNPIEGKFGQAKSRYGMNRIKARLQQTSESWIASIVMVLNLVKLAGQVPYYLLFKILKRIKLLINLNMMMCRT
jgi:IS5 family transposase